MSNANACSTHVSVLRRASVANISPMSALRIALANIPFPGSPEDSVTAAVRSIAAAADAGAHVACFPECYVPGYRVGKAVSPVSPEFLEKAWSSVQHATMRARLTVVLGTERFVDGKLRATALVIAPDGVRAGFQDKVQLDPSEDDTYTPGSERRVFRAGEATFGIVICHEGFRYPETVRWAARRGAQVVFHPQFHEATLGSFRPSTYGDAANTFHEQVVLCRAAENTCYFATVNCASPGSPTTSAIARPDGTLLACQPYGEEGLLVADLDLGQATGLLATRFRPMS